MKAKLVIVALLILLALYAFKLKGDVSEAYATCAAGYVQFALDRRDALDAARAEAARREEQVQVAHARRLEQLERELEQERRARADTQREFKELLAGIEDPETIEWLEISLPSHVLALP